MPSANNLQGADNPDRRAPRSPASPLADVVSLETLVNVLVRKGICSPEELFEEERRNREYKEEVKGITVVKTPRPGSDEQSQKVKKRKQSWLKRKMSKKRWSRTLGTRCFGWQWKKVKIEKAQKQESHVEVSH